MDEGSLTGGAAPTINSQFFPRPVRRVYAGLSESPLDFDPRKLAWQTAVPPNGRAWLLLAKITYRFRHFPIPQLVVVW
jgi:hypothetical protein